MVPTGSAAPAGHRRISSFKTSTFNFFKGNNNKTFLYSPGGTRRNELTISGPLPYTEENVSPTTLTPPSRADTEPTVSHRYKFPAVFEIGSSRTAQGSARRGSSAVDEEEEHGDESITVGMDLRDFSPSRQTQNDTETNVDDKRAALPPPRTKTKGAKLKLALSLLRRRSNTNLRRAYVDPADERYGSSDEREPFIEPLMDPDFIDRSNAGSRMSSTASTVRPAPQQKSSGFKFAFTARNHNRQVLTKQPPADARRPRRATVASIVDPAMSCDLEHPRTSVWSILSPRPSSSQSVIPKGMEEGYMNPDGTPGNPGGGLFPRPASLQRNWSDGPRHQHETSGVSNADSFQKDSSRPTSQDQARPLSFAGMLNGYSSMKITEAVSLETRVKELEKEVETLKEFITQSDPRPSGRRNFSTTTAPEHPLDSNTLNVPKFTQRTYSISSAGSSDKVDSSEFPSTPRNLGPPPRPDQGTSKVRGHSPHATQGREGTLKTLEDNRGDTGSGRDTSSTIRAPHNSTDRSPSPPTPTVSFAQYTKLVALVRREQRARRKAEAQIANLQEQMAMVLHRQLLSSSPTDTVHSAGLPRPSFNSIRRKTSSEVPTPDLTPPRTSPTNYHAIPGHLFTGFDSEAVIDESDYENDEDDDDDNDDDESLFIGVDADDNEIWETPAEDRESMIDDSDSDRVFRETLSAFPSPQQRTMSLSQLTHKSSIAAR